jgi:apolipoprotein N-acyltransferase
MVTVVGIPAGLALLFVVPILIFVSYAVAATGLADLIFNRPRAPRLAGRTFGFLIVGAIILGLVSLIPVAGGMLVFLLLILGAGAFLRSARRRAKRSRRAPPVGPSKSQVAA